MTTPANTTDHTSKLIPNSFQVPNWYVDICMPLLTFSAHMDAHLPLLGMILKRIETQRWEMNRLEKHAT